MNKTNFFSWFDGLSPNVKFSSGQDILNRFYSETNTRPRSTLPLWAQNIAMIAGPQYVTKREKDSNRAKKNYYAKLF